MAEAWRFAGGAGNDDRKVIELLQRTLEEGAVTTAAARMCRSVFWYWMFSHS